MGWTTEAARDFCVKESGKELEEKAARGPGKTLEGIAADFFKDNSPWVWRQHAKGRSFGKAQGQNRQGHLDHHILQRFGKTELRDITKPDIGDWLITLPLANATRNAIMYTMRIVLREARLGS
jgi:hypothetical protein